MISAPVLGFLAALVLLESYKLVTLSTVVAVVAAGAIVAAACYFANAWLMERLGLALAPYSRYVAPVVEEFMKAAIMGVLVHTHRVGFLVDGAILGFAAGGGFAVVENVYYQQIAADAGLGAWIGRGFGATNRPLDDPANQPRLDAVDALIPVAEAAGLSLTHMAHAFVLEHPAVTSAIIGPRTEQLDDALAGVDVRLDADTLDAIDAVVPPGVDLATGEPWPLPGLSVDRRRRSVPTATLR